MDVIGLNFVYSLKDLWPLIFIVIGVNIIFDKIPIVKSLMWVILIVILILYSTYDLDLNSTKFVSEYETGFYEVKKVDNIDKGSLRMELPAGSLKIDSTSEKSFNAKYPKGYARITDVTTSDMLSINLIPQKNGDFIIGAKNNEIDLELDDKLAWDIVYDGAFLDAGIDMRENKLDSLDIDIAFSNVDIRLGDNQEKSDISIDSAFSNTTIHVPSTTGVKVIFNGAIKNMDIDMTQWEKTENIYRTKNYSQADEFLIVNINCAIGNVEIIRE
jgi:predicted membrane protein